MASIIRAGKRERHHRKKPQKAQDAQEGIPHSLLGIRVVVDDGEGAIKLLEEENSTEVVSES